MPLADYTLELPLLALLRQDWDGQIREADGLRKRMLQQQQIALHALNEVNAEPTTPEKLAWLVLWTRAFDLQRAAFDLCWTLSQGICVPLFRLAMELSVHVSAIRAPFDDLAEGPNDPNEAWPAVADRLRGYAAWCLIHDLKIAQDFLHDDYVTNAFIATPRDDTPNSPVQRAIGDWLWGKPEVVSEAEAEHDAKNWKRERTAELARIQDWLCEPSLSDWSRRICEMRHPKRLHQLPSLYELFGTTEQSMYARMRSQQQSHLYRHYAQTSNLLHGSTIEQYIVVSDHTVIPRTVFGSEFEHRAEALANTAHVSMIGLLGMRDACLRT